MPYCAGCGAELAADIRNCPRCGSATAGKESHENSGRKENSALSENVSGLLCYSLGWITGLIFFLVDRRPTVRFHAIQSILTFGSLHLLHLLLAAGGGHAGFMGAAMGNVISLGSAAFQLLVLILWIVCMVKAYQGQRMKLPLVGGLAESYSRP